MIGKLLGVGLGSGNAALIAQTRSDRDALIEKASVQIKTHSDEVSQGVLTSSIEQLVQSIQDGRLTSTTIVEVFIKQAILAQRMTNCLTEVNFEAALERAAQLDKHFAATKTLVGPLHGVPFSLKDQFHLKGKRSSTGYSEWLKRPVEEEDCMFAQMAQSLGAICLAKTNVPQTMLSFECRNPVWGQTSNPYSKAHTSGGSSGGEAALLAVGGAAFGYGSDIGGSLRIPTSYCGIYALKPSINRPWPLTGSASFQSRPTAISAVAGPMCRSLDDLEFLVRLFTDLLSPSPESGKSLGEVQGNFHSSNTTLAVLPLRPAWFDPINVAKERRRKLRVGYYFCDGFSVTSPACVRAVEVARDALSFVEQVELVEVAPSDMDVFQVLKLFVALTSITAYEHLRRYLGPDLIDPSLFVVLTLPRFSILRWFVAIIATFVLGDRIMPQVFALSNLQKASRYFDYGHELEKRKAAFQKRVWKELDLDVIIAPVSPLPAFPQFGTTLVSATAASTIVFNAFGNPVAVVPVTRVDAQRDHWPAPKTGRSSTDTVPGTETCSPMVAANLRKQYDAQTQRDLPLGVQVIAPEFEDERAIGMAKVLENALARADRSYKQEFGPGAWMRFVRLHPDRFSLSSGKKDKTV